MTRKETAVLAADERMPAVAGGIPAVSTDYETGDPDETVAVEYEGRAYQVPKVLKAALMRQAEYTSKTQELAQRRKAVEAVHENLVHGDKVHRLALAHLQMLDEQLAPFGQMQLSALNAQDPRMPVLLDYVAKLKAARDQVASAIQNHQQNQTLNLQRARARQVEEGRAKLHQEIEGWSPDVAHRIVQAGKAHGFSEEEIHSVTDPRMIVVLNKARLFADHKAQEAAAKRQTAEQAVKPAVEVGAQAPAANDPSRLSTADWMRWRATQLRKRN